MVDFHQLDAGLDRLETALITGDLQNVEGLAAALEAGLAAVGRGDRSLALRTAEKARRNAELISAALKGIHFAQRRVGELSDQGRFSTYESDGHRKQPGLRTSISGRRL